MKKKWIIALIIIVLVGIITGIIFYVISQKNNEELQGTDVIEETELANSNNSTNSVNFVETSVAEDVISPNAVIIKKEYFKGCDHLSRTVEDIPEELVNGTEEDVGNAYSDWKVEEYSSTKIILYKEYDGYCDEHYVVKDYYGVIGIYTIDEDGNEVFEEETEISTKYLPDSDVELLEEGVNIIGKTNLIEFLEDFE